MNELLKKSYTFDTIEGFEIYTKMEGFYKVRKFDHYHNLTDTYNATYATLEAILQMRGRWDYEFYLHNTTNSRNFRSLKHDPLTEEDEEAPDPELIRILKKKDLTLEEARFIEDHEDVGCFHKHGPIADDGRNVITVILKSGHIAEVKY